MKRADGRQQFDSRAAHALIARLVADKEEAMRLGLIKTFHAMDGATTAVGWEVAEAMQGKHPLLKNLTDAVHRNTTLGGR